MGFKVAAIVAALFGAGWVISLLVTVVMSRQVVAQSVVDKPVAVLAAPAPVETPKKKKFDFEPTMLKIEGGEFQMGCDPKRDDVEGGCSDSEKPLHKVTVPTFLLAETEVTVAQFRAFADATKYKTTAEENGSCWSFDAKGEWSYVKGNSWQKLGFKQTDDHPGWNDSQAYLKWLSGETGVVLRLPSEAEWEYAARGKSDTAFFWGKAVGDGNANCWKDQCGDSFEFTSPVGSFAKNEFGLFDMNGNVWEWVEDRWHYNYDGAPTDGSAWISGDSSGGVLRGGSWSYDPQKLRSAYRLGISPAARYTHVGFRPAQDYRQ